MHIEPDENEALTAAAHLRQGEVIPLTESIVLSASAFGIESKLPLADSIVYATGVTAGAEIYTQDTHFKGLKGVTYLGEQADEVYRFVETYGEYVEQNSFEPLGMVHNHTSWAGAKQDRLAVGHRLIFGFPRAKPELPLPVGSLPSGQLISSAADMGHYLVANLNGGRYKGNSIISPAGMTELHRPAVPYPDSAVC